MNVRELTQQIERDTLSPFASLSENTRGRKSPRPLCEIRTEFQRDRDKIIHSKSFRRLKHKTQVFITPEGDHYRTRLTHTLEVAQIGRTIARGLRLNEDLIEAMALGHDLGHTPFGHAGERVLSSLCESGFRHNEQSLRVAEKLENLNLTYEVLDGILCHTGDKKAFTLEGVILKYADRIAYINHDIDDALRAGIISKEEIPSHILDTLGHTHGERINTLVSDIISASWNRNEIAMSPDVENAMTEFRSFMFKNVYIGSSAKEEESKVQSIIEALFTYYCKNPSKLPSQLVEIAKTEGVHQAVCDYIAGMSDRFAIYMFNNLFVPRSWNKI